jgi:hypothetical protein
MRKFGERRVWVFTRPAIVLLLLAFFMQQPLARRARSFTPQVWVVTSGTAFRVAYAAPALAASLFDPLRSVVLGFPIGGGEPTALAWASEASFERDIRGRSIPAQVDTVMYDPENWPSTPRSERIDPIAAIDAFSASARAQGYRVIITPHPNLVTVAGGRCTVGPGEAIEDAYVRCDIAGQAAKVADIVETQAQMLETDPAAYRKLVAATTEQARAANPDVLVLSGLSTTYTDSPVALYDAWMSVNDVVDGHYVSAPHGLRQDALIGFLKLLPA